MDDVAFQYQKPTKQSKLYLAAIICKQVCNHMELENKLLIF